MTKDEKLEKIKTTTDAHKFCAACGGRMSLRKFETQGFDTQTGEPLKAERFVWGCVMGDVGHDWLDV